MGKTYYLELDGFPQGGKRSGILSIAVTLATFSLEYVTPPRKDAVGCLGRT